MKRLLAALLVAVALATARAASQAAPPVRVAVLVDNGFLVGAAVNSIRQGLQMLVDGLPSSDEILLATIAGSIRFSPAATPMLVGLYITAAYWFTASTSFANPAVTLARMLSNSFAGIAPHSVRGFVVAQLLAVAAGYVVFPWLFSGTRSD